MPYFEFTIESCDGLKLQGRDWEPDAGTKAVVCLVHGLGEHCGRYGHVAEAFNHAGYALVAFDQRGHGRSEGRRGQIPNYTALMDDIFQLLETAKKRHPDIPVFLYGHSLGGNLVLHYTLRRSPELAGLIASAPMLRMAHPRPQWQVALLEIPSALRLPSSFPNGIDAADLSHDPQVVQAYRDDPLTHERISPTLAVEMIKNGEWNLAHAANLPCPLLLMHGNADRITSAEASKEFASRAGDVCTLKIWDGFYHELHNEPEKKYVLDYMLAWMDQTL
ncbi:MAG: lysophospholipase [Verrucomicrobiota bacterium]